MRKKVLATIMAGILALSPINVSEVNATTTDSHPCFIMGGGISRVLSEYMRKDYLNHLSIDDLTSEDIINLCSEEELIDTNSSESNLTMSTDDKVDAGYYSDFITDVEDDDDVSVENNDHDITSKEPVQTSVVFDTSDVTKISGASVETFNKILEGTWLEGYGDTYYEMENEYGVNALFSIGNAIMETGWGGDNYLARNNNNIYGLNMSRRFSSKRECIDYWFNLISKHYVGEDRQSIKSIGKKYCPPNADIWANDIPIIVRKLISNADLTLR